MFLRFKYGFPCLFHHIIFCRFSSCSLFSVCVVVFSEGEFGLLLQKFVRMITLICLVRKIGFSCFVCCFAFLHAPDIYIIISLLVWVLILILLFEIPLSIQTGGESCFSYVLGFHVVMPCVGFRFSCYMFLKSPKLHLHVIHVFHLMFQDSLILFFIYSYGTNICFGDCGTDSCFAEIMTLRKKFVFCWL